MFTKGEVVWAKIRGYPWWPGIVKKNEEIFFFQILEKTEIKIKTDVKNSNYAQSRQEKCPRNEKLIIFS